MGKKRARGVKYRRIKWGNAILLLILLTGTATAGVYGILSALREEKGQPSVLETISARAGDAAARRIYSLSIEEWGPGYELHFSGQSGEGKVYGELDEYGLEVYAEGGSYYSRDNQTGKWQNIEECGLKDLSFFIRDPLEILNDILQEQGIKAEEGEERLISGTPCRSYYLEISPRAAEKIVLPERDGEIADLKMYVWFDENNILRRMAMTVRIGSGVQKTEITRIYNLNPAENNLPDDLPQGQNFTVRLPQ